MPFLIYALYGMFFCIVHLSATEIPRHPFYFVRHGVTEWNDLDKQQGQSDIPLNERGRAQCQLLRSVCDTLPITHFHSSTLSRAYETMQILNSVRRLPEYSHDDLKEQGKGFLEGITGEEWTLLDREVIIAGMEKKDLFEARTQRVLRTILSSDGLPCIVAHSNNVRCISNWLGCPIDHVPHNIIWFFEPLPDGIAWKATELAAW